MLGKAMWRLRIQENPSATDSNSSNRRGTGIRGLMRRMATLRQGNQELLVVRDKVGRLPGELGISKSKSMECDIFPACKKKLDGNTG